MTNLEKARIVLERKGIEATIVNGLLYVTLITEGFINCESVAIHEVEIEELATEY